jgi:hypothetical protein
LEKESNTVVGVENCRHTVVEEICNQPSGKENNMVVGVESCRHTVVVEICMWA